LIIGFAMAVPVGPLGVMCIRKTLTEGRTRGIIIGLGAATGDLLYGSIAAFGLTFISDTIDGQRVWLRLVGGIILLFLGVRTYRAHPVDPTADGKKRGLWRSYLTTILLTFTNPITIFSFIAVLAALGLGHGLSFSSALTLVVGIFAGSLLWFVLLSSGVVLFRKNLDHDGMRWVNRIAGILILLSAGIAFGSLL
jgi:threonine/homoserine/homoserine lactone efflux protein